VTQNTAELLESEDNETVLKDLGIAKMLRCRIPYFTLNGKMKGRFLTTDFTDFTDFKRVVKINWPN
jgi:hypothetical protein